MKATEARLTAALDRPPADLRLYLLHGSDEATAQAHAARLGRALGQGAERVDLDGATLRGDPARLSDEAAAISLFGDGRTTDRLYCRRLLARDGWGRAIRPATRLGFYVRSHWLRMPPAMLARHLWIKWRKAAPA